GARLRLVVDDSQVVPNPRRGLGVAVSAVARVAMQGGLNSLTLGVIGEETEPSGGIVVVGAALKHYGFNGLRIGAISPESYSDRTGSTEINARLGGVLIGSVGRNSTADLASNPTDTVDQIESIAVAGGIHRRG